ncbi:hypothetical protein BH23PAT2_BH23PAT2_02510 [soil metagenome]
MKQVSELLCVSANGKRIVFDPVDSHTATHFKDAPTLRARAEELLSSISLEGDLIAKDVDMGKVVGNSDVVEIDYKDDVVYAMRRNREDQGHVPFTKSRSSQTSTKISIYLVKKDSENYELSSVWIGEYESPMFPQMSNATAESVPYWSKHAFVWGSQEIISGTTLHNCPW